jgi:fermentation-respiration switch protein FrsA (DUF1100 family)
MENSLAEKPRKRWKSILKWSLITLTVAVAFFFLAYVPYFLANVVTHHRYHYPDKDDGQTPATYQVSYRDIEFSSSDGISLKGWFVPVEHPRGTFIFVHGLNRTRVELLRQAMFVHRLGYNGLLFDLRHSGASGGKVTSMGYYERLDVEAAVAEAMNLDPQTKPVTVWGVSMGAVAALMAAKETPTINAVICDSTFLTLRDTTYHHLKLFLHLPRFPIPMTALWLVERFAHFDADALDLREAVHHIGDRPILFVAGGADNRMPSTIALELFHLARDGYKMFLDVPRARHGEAFRTDPQLYETAVREFLDRSQQDGSSGER